MNPLFEPYAMKSRIPCRIRYLFCLLTTLISLLNGCASQNAATPLQKQAQQSLSGIEHKAVREALQLQGHRYVLGGESPQEGFDCSGLVYYVYGKHGLKLPRDTWSQANQLPPVQNERRQPGDLLFFNTAHQDSHVGIYIGDDHFVHAPSQHTGRVMVSSLQHPYWRLRFNAVRRPSATAHSQHAFAIH